MRTLLAVAVLLLIAPAAVAQVPQQPQGCGPLTVVATTPSGVGPGEAAEFRVTVTNTGSRAVEVTVVADTTSEGWSVTSAAEQRMNVAAGLSGTATFTVAPDESARDDATVNVATTGACPAPGSLPCPANAPPNSCTTQGPPQTVVVGYQAPQGFRVPGLDGLDIPLAYLLAGILLVAGAVAVPFLLRRRKPARATATCPEPLKTLRPGRGASFPIELRNPSDAPRKLHLAVGAVPEGWSAFLPLPEIQLAAQETRSLWLMVRSPPDARAGEYADVDVTATDAGRPERPSVVKVRAEVQPDAPEPSAL